MKTILRIFSKRWLLATLLVVGGVALCVRLGIWQLDRLHQRREFNSRVEAQIDQPQLELSGAALQDDLYNMEFRKATVTGRYDFSQQIAITNQTWQNQWGVHLVTPLIIAGTQQAILVDRGWIPGADYESGNWSKYDEPGVVTVSGILRRPQTKADWGRRSDPPLAAGEPFRKAWNFVNISELSKQVQHPLLPAYLQQAPDPQWTTLPYRDQATVEITEGPHMSYALQWFSFAILLGVGYPFFVRRQEHLPRRTRQEPPLYD
jgi:surfeit locus 1 family protein